MERHKWDGLCNPASIYYFEKWYLFGGPQGHVTINEILETPAWAMDDFSLILEYVSEEEDIIERHRPKPLPPKPPARRR